MSLKNKSKGISVILIGLTILLNIFMFNSLPSEMLIKVNANQTMSKLVVLSLCPILSILLFWISNEREDQVSNGVSIIMQLILFITNFIVIYINMK